MPEIRDIFDFVSDLTDVSKYVAAIAATAALLVAVFYRKDATNRDAIKKLKAASVADEKHIEACEEEIEQLKMESPSETLKRIDKSRSDENPGDEFYDLTEFFSRTADNIATLAYRLGEKRFGYALANNSDSDLREAQRLISLARCLAASNKEYGDLDESIKARLLGTALANDQSPANVHDVVDWLGLRDDEHVRSAVRALCSEVQRELGNWRFASGLAAARMAYDLAKRLPSGDASGLPAGFYLANALRMRGGLLEAEKVARKTWEAMEVMLSLDHPDTIMTGTLLANILEELGRSKEAQPIAVEMYCKPRPAGVPNAWYPGTVLALVLRNLAHHKEAADIVRKQLAEQRSLLPSDNMAIFNSEWLLASILQDSGELIEAESIARKAWVEMKSVLPASDLNTVRVGSLLSLILSKLGKNEEAEPLASDVWDFLKGNLPLNSPSTLEAGYTYAVVLHRLGRNEQAEVIARSVWQAQKAVLADDASPTLRTGHILSAILQKLDRNEEAASIARATWDKQKILLGDCSDTRHTGELLVSILRGLGREQEATVIVHDLEELRQDRNEGWRQTMIPALQMGEYRIVGTSISAQFLPEIRADVSPSLPRECSHHESNEAPFESEA